MDDAIAEPEGSPADYEWGRPVPLEAVPDPKTFPTDALPGWVRDMVLAASEAFQVPAELPGLLALTVAAVAGGGRVFVKLNEGWVEPTNIYTVTALGPGELKSPTYKALMAPIKLVEKELQAAAVPYLAQLRLQREVLAKDIDRHKTAAMKTDDPDVRAGELAQAARLIDELARLPHAVEPRLSTPNATPEELERLMVVHGGRFAALHDEGGFFDIMADQYSKKPSLEVFLSGHNGGEIGSDRKGRDGKGESVRIDAGYLTMGFTVQPVVLADLGKNGRLNGKGVTARFLYAVPKSLRGHRDLVNATPIPAEVRGPYDDRVAALFRRLVSDVEGPFPAPVELTLSKKAQTQFRDFQTRTERALAPHGYLYWIPEWGGKLCGQLGRIAGLLHMLKHWDDPKTTVISGETMAAAIQIAICLIDHARAAHDMLGMDDDMADARKLLRWIEDERKTHFSGRDTYRSVRSLKTSDRAYAALRILEEYGWVQELPSDGAAHRQERLFVVHPFANGGRHEINDFEELT